MRKSALAMAAAAAMGVMGSANAGWFMIQSATVGGTSLTTPTGTYTSGNASATFNVSAGTIAQAGATGVAFGSGAAVTTTILTSTQTSSIATAVGAAAGELRYFGFDTGGTAPGYFGFIYQAVGGESFSWNFSGADAANAANGVFASADIGYTGGTGMAQGWVGNAFVGSIGSATAGQIYLAIFAGMGAGDVIGGANVSDTSNGMNVRYLSYSGSAWNVVGSANGASSSNLNFATYQVPVPAPALLAGAGLVGAAALRRRMAKKA